MTRRPVILTVSGGPRGDGCSAELLRRFTEKLHAVFTHYDAYRERFAPCTDCRFCRRHEGCAMHDMDGFYADFEAADGIVIASPVYNMSFPAPMKAILDRMQRYYSARFFLGKRPPIAKRRPVALLLSAGSPDEDGAMIEKQLGKIFTVTNCELLCRVTVKRQKIGNVSHGRCLVVADTCLAHFKHRAFAEHAEHDPVSVNDRNMRISFRKHFIRDG